jgi:hypothetical protein
MNAGAAIQNALTSTQQILNWYVSDLADADLLVRPAPNANHIAWQLGHVIAAERGLMSAQGLPHPYPELAAGFSERYLNKESSAANEGFGTKAQYLDLFEKIRGATIANAAKLSDADFDKPTVGNMAKFAPTLGALFILQANHTMMHAGQFTVVRRKLGKPVLF